MTRLPLLTFLLGAFLWGDPADAARLAVMPVRIDVAADTRFCAVQISNEGDQAVAVQIRVFHWAQDEQGHEQLREAAVAINPAIVVLPPTSRRLVRCALPPVTSAVEASYRLLIDEIPQAVAVPGTLQTLLRLSLPVFHASPAASTQLRWAPMADGIVVSNGGPVHAELARVMVTRAHGAPTPVNSAGFYLLANARRRLPIAGAGAIERVEATLVSGKKVVLDRAAD